ncbi:MAG: NAD(P)/FAD-dependent oxidoreductase [Pseudomonadota bacterium]
MAQPANEVTNSFVPPTPEELGFDPNKLRQRYLDERDRRLRKEGIGQYQEVAGKFEKYQTDHYIEQPIVREAIEEELDVVIIGGGFGGLLAAARLQEVGISDARIIEKAGDFGGTWYWNRYPGAQCDIESYVYMPLLEETNYIPKEKYAYGPEIFEHAQRIGRHFGLYDQALFQTQVEQMRWDDGSKRWQVFTDRGDLLKARFVITSSGPLNRPKLPGLPGIETFKGHTFHTSRWDYEYTGGDSSGSLDRLGDKRVGIVGTGATAIQCVPALGKYAQQLYVFQRTPSSIDERGNKPTDPQWAKSLEPGWQARRNLNFCSIMSGIPQTEDLVNDRWTDLFKALAKLMAAGGDSAMSMEEVAFMSEVADFTKMNEIRSRVEKSVSDSDTAEALKPWYKQWCKRPTFNDEFLPTFNLPNVELVDTEGQGVERVTENGVVVNGIEYEVDCLIFATGFEVGTAYTRRGEFEIVGRDGLSLADYWAEGMKTFHGFFSKGFPNIFHMGLTQTGLAPNFTYMLGEQSQHIAYVIQQVNQQGAKTVETTGEAEAGWVETVSQPSFFTEYLSSCTPGYYNSEGNVGEGNGLFDGQYGEGAVQFYMLLERWREQGGLEGLVIE